MPVTIDFTKNAKQTQLFNDVMMQCERHGRIVQQKLAGEIAEDFDDPEAINFWFYGGAIRGGKTYSTLGILVVLCRMYAGGRAHVIRKSMTDLIATSIPSLKKIVKGADVRWKESPNDYFCEFPNGSRIYFTSENFNQDKDGDKFKGLETNWIVFEQLEELQEKTYTIAISRIGSWYDTEPAAPAFAFATFNPTFNWVKKKVHDVFSKEAAQPPHYYLQALPDDNPFVTADQRRAWAQMDEQDYERFIKGSWDVKIEGTFITAFKNHHIGITRIDKWQPIWLSFDFNVDPMTCTVWQTDGYSWARCLQEYRVPNSDTYELCRMIVDDWGYDYEMYVTGDASGSNRNPAIRHQLNHYDIIRDELRLGRDAFKVPTFNPAISVSRMFCNAVIKNLDEFVIDDGCKYLIDDIRFVQAYLDASGNVAIRKTGINPYANMDNRKLGHLLDTMRYFLHTALAELVTIPKS
jgi:hypothetical protein